MTAPAGRRERKKAQTRKALADAALALFLDRGYDQVGVREVADAADVSVTTLFKYFPSKESLVFDLDEDVEASLVATVRDRPPGRSIPQALREHILRREAAVDASPDGRDLMRLVEDTPALRHYAREMWLRHEKALTRAIAGEVGAPEDDVACAALARFALESGELARGRDDLPRTIDAVFTLLEQGWSAAHPDA